MPGIHRSLSQALRMPFTMPSNNSSQNSGHRISVVSDHSASGATPSSSVYNSQRNSHIEPTGGYSPDDERSPSTPTANVQYSTSDTSNDVSRRSFAPTAYASNNGISQPIISSHERDASLSTLPSMRDSAYMQQQQFHGNIAFDNVGDPFPSPLTPNAATFLINRPEDNDAARHSRHSSRDFRFSTTSSLYNDNYDSTSLYTIDSKIDDDALNTLAPRPGIHQSDSSGRTSRRTSNHDGDSDDDDADWNTEPERMSLSNVGEAYMNQMLLGGVSPEASPLSDKVIMIGKETGKYKDMDKDKDRDKGKMRDGKDGINDDDEELYTNGDVPARASTPKPGAEGFGVKENGESSSSAAVAATATAVTAATPTATGTTGYADSNNKRNSKRQSVGLWQREESLEVLREEIWRLMSVVEDEVDKRERMRAEMKTFKQVMYHNTKCLIKNSHVDLNKSYMRIQPLLNDAGRFPDPVIFPLTVGALMKLNDATLTSLIVFYGLQQADMQYYSKFSALRDHLGIDP